MYNAHFKRSKWLHNLVHSGVDNCDSYIDDTDKKIRYIFLDNYSLSDRTERPGTFLTNTLSSLGEDYKAILFSHNALSSEFSNVYRYPGDTDDNPEPAFYQPSDSHTLLDQYADKIIACICGHAHTDAWAFSSSGILYIETTSAVHTRLRFDIIPYKSSYNDANETAFDFFVIDIDNQTIEAVRYGRGTNRKWKYKGTGQGLISYKNCVNGISSVPSVTLTFTNASDNTDVVSAAVDSEGFYETYLTLGATYNITCSGYTMDVNSVTINENKNVDLVLTEA
jgi:hypothetical protein